MSAAFLSNAFSSSQDSADRLMSARQVATAAAADTFNTLWAQFEQKPATHQIILEFAGYVGLRVLRALESDEGKNTQSVAANDHIASKIVDVSPLIRNFDPAQTNKILNDMWRQFGNDPEQRAKNMYRVCLPVFCRRIVPAIHQPGENGKSQPVAVVSFFNRLIDMCQGDLDMMMQFKKAASEYITATDRMARRHATRPEQRLTRRLASLVKILEPGDRITWGQRGYVIVKPPARFAALTI